MAITGSVQIKNGKYYAVLNLYDNNGKRHNKWINSNLTERGNKKKADKFLQEKILEYEDFNIDYHKLMFADYLETWLKKAEKEVRPNTYRAYKNNMNNHIIPYFKAHKVLLQQVTPFILEDYYKSKLEKNSNLTNAAALSPTTIKHHHQNICKALSDALRNGMIKLNPANSAKTPKAERYKYTILNKEQIKDLWTLITQSPIKTPVQLCSIYAVRRSEVCGLKWKNVDFVNRTICIAETLQQNTGGDYTDIPKTNGSYRTFPMNDISYELLKEVKHNQEERKKLLGNYYIDSDYVCTRDDGAVIHPNYLTKTYRAIIDKSNLPYVRLHDLRHSVASNLLNSGHSIVEVQEWLGHSNASTTLNYYAHTDKTSKSHVAKSLDKMLDN